MNRASDRVWSNEQDEDQKDGQIFFLWKTIR